LIRSSQVKTCYVQYRKVQHCLHMIYTPTQHDRLRQSAMRKCPYEHEKLRHMSSREAHALRRCLAMSTQMREEEQPMPARLYVKTSLRILNLFRIIAAMDGVGAKQLHDVMTTSI
jgi:hypothetical protein